MQINLFSFLLLAVIILLLITYQKRSPLIITSMDLTDFAVQMSIDMLLEIFCHSVKLSFNATNYSIKKLSLDLCPCAKSIAVAYNYHKRDFKTLSFSKLFIVRIINDVYYSSTFKTSQNRNYTKRLYTFR